MILYLDPTDDENGNPRGNDKNPGTIDKPLATSEEAYKRIKNSEKGFFYQGPGKDFLINKEA